jgi:hypothetical protein
MNIIVCEGFSIANFKSHPLSLSLFVTGKNVKDSLWAMAGSFSVGTAYHSALTLRDSLKGLCFLVRDGQGSYMNSRQLDQTTT